MDIPESIRSDLCKKSILAAPILTFGMTGCLGESTFGQANQHEPRLGWVVHRRFARDIQLPHARRRLGKRAVEGWNPLEVSTGAGK